uniref:Caffeoyl- O-methyltransferase At4g26220 n=1 Tax=Bixa orellana TaxID=66672 RepID=A0A9Y1EIE1_BIXOR|nr:putative caffeoyl- O-methyltransferase At4g26220 [Bixa orellana]
MQPANEGSFDFAFVDADKVNLEKYHERLLKLVRVGGLIVHDNTLWGGTLVKDKASMSDTRKKYWQTAIDFNKFIAADTSVEISQVPIGDGMTICRRLY